MQKIEIEEELVDDVEMREEDLEDGFEFDLPLQTE